MKFKIVCYHTITHQKMKVYKIRDFDEALLTFLEEVAKEEAFIDVRFYKGFTKITSQFMGNDYYKELKEQLEHLKLNSNTVVKGNC